MKTPYKVALLTAVVLCVFVISYYTLQSGEPGNTADTDDVGTPAGAVEDDRSAEADDRRTTRLGPPPGSGSRTGATTDSERTSTGASTSRDVASAAAADAAADDADGNQFMNDLRARLAAANGSAATTGAGTAGTGDADQDTGLASPGGTSPRGARDVADLAEPSPDAGDGLDRDATDLGDAAGPTPTPIPRPPSNPPSTTGDTGATAGDTLATRSSPPSPLVGGTSTTRNPATGTSTATASGTTGSTTRSTLANRTTTTTARPTASSTATPPRTYTVEAGDTLSSIAQKIYGQERVWVDIAQANPTVDPIRLRVGQELRLPDPEDLREAESSEPRPAAPAATVTYTVRAGDTLSSIARQYYGDPTQWRVIYNANRAKIGNNPNQITAGDTLTIPPAPRGAE